MYKEITQEIIDILKADETLGSNVITYYFGEHDLRKPATRFPFIDVKWRGGPVKKVKSGTLITRRTIDFMIRCVQRHVEENIAEQFIMENTEQIETVLDAEPTLDGTVESHEITEILSDSIAEGGYSVVGSLIRLRIKK